MPKAPDGGLQAWLQVLGGFFIYFNTWGLMISFGVFQSYYENHVLTDVSSSAISWIGTIQAFFLIEVGVITGPLYDRGRLRLILATGFVLLPLGIMMASISTSYYAILLSMGICTGIDVSNAKQRDSMGCMFFPGITSINTYFNTRRGLASGVAATGSGVGAIVYPILLRELMLHISFPWAVRVVGFIILATSLIPLLVIRPLWLPSHRRKLVDMTIFKDRIYTFWSMANIISWVGVQIPIFYATLYATDIVGVSQDNAFYMSAVLGAGSLPGRLLTAVASDHFGPLWVYAATFSFAGVLALVWMRVTTYAGLIIVILLYGAAYGGISSLPPAAVATLSPDLSSLGTRIGTSFSFAGIAILVGPPIAGAIKGNSHGFQGAFGFSGAATVAGSLVLFFAAFVHQRKKSAAQTKT
ncbi:major facilitator superfamily domain-containing protein [Coniella lustricola]|uniref:Major facilitator superfamily domain-containing protein n=1 Tax=Coniella lustricola TaxID=2025994 RepID=A0A2T2ZZU1_9PEZI|nr:major facilitator superfamily domain-containing protein [Coniella lustricola]